MHLLPNARRVRVRATLPLLAALLWAADASGPRPRPRLYEKVCCPQRIMRVLLLRNERSLCKCSLYCLHIC